MAEISAPSCLSTTSLAALAVDFSSDSVVSCVRRSEDRAWKIETHLIVPPSFCLTNLQLVS